MNTNFSRDEEILIIVSLHERIEKYTRLVQTFEGDEKYSGFLKNSKDELAKTIDLLNKIKEGQKRYEQR